MAGTLMSSTAWIPTRWLTSKQKAPPGVMAAYVEGLDILGDTKVGKRQRAPEAETTPLEHPSEHYQYDLDLPAITELWRRGSAIGSWLLDLTARALLGDPELSKFGGRVSDSGEGESANKLLSAMRFEFGGHEEKLAPGAGVPREKG